MQNYTFAVDNVSFDSEIAEIKEADGKLAGVVLSNVFTGKTRDLDVTGLFVTLGHEPHAELFKGQMELDSEGYLKAESPSTRTSVPVVFGSGDVVDHAYRQATAAASSCSAALDTERYLAALADVQAEALAPAS